MNCEGIGADFCAYSKLSDERYRIGADWRSVVLGIERQQLSVRVLWLPVPAGGRDDRECRHSD